VHRRASRRNIKERLRSREQCGLTHLRRFRAAYLAERGLVLLVWRLARWRGLRLWLVSGFARRRKLLRRFEASVEGFGYNGGRIAQGARSDGPHGNGKHADLLVCCVRRLLEAARQARLHCRLHADGARHQASQEVRCGRGSRTHRKASSR
jgi:hypothetical protein